MEHGGVVVLNLAAVFVGDVYRGDVAGHNLLAKNVAVALYLFAYSRTAVVAVKHSRVRLFVAYRPHHALEDERRIGAFALHEGKDEVLVVDIEIAHILYQPEGLVVGVVEQAYSVAAGRQDGFLHHLYPRQLFVVAELNVVSLVFVFYAQHLADGMQRAEIHSVCSSYSSAAKSLVGFAGHSYVEQGGHQAGYVLWHGAAYGENQWVLVAA